MASSAAFILEGSRSHVTLAWLFCAHVVLLIQVYLDECLAPRASQGVLK